MKSGILIVSFGTTYPGTRAKNIGKITECVRTCYPDAIVKEAVSSQIVRTAMQKRENLPAMDTETALQVMRAEGVTHVTVLPTHIIDGIENNQMKQAVENCWGLFEVIHVADVLLAQEEDYIIAARALWESVKDEVGNAPVIFMGHGTTHEADASYQRMEAALREYTGGRPVYMATVEGTVTIEDVIAKMAREIGCPEADHCRIVVTPFMLVAGDHAMNDMAGDKDSFVSRLREEGYAPECIIRGIGEYPAMREIYLSHLRKAIVPTMGCNDPVRQKQGILYGIGVGPGDPELMTLQAVRTLRACDILILPAVSKEECYAYQIVVRELPEIAEKPILCMPFPMIRDAAKLELAHRRIYEAIADYLDQGQIVGLLTIGDPTVYSTYMYMHHRAANQGKCARIVSGIPSFCAVAARLGISLGEKEEEIHIIPASYDIRDTLDYHGTRIYMKSGKKLQELVELLEKEQEKTGDLQAETYKVTETCNSIVSDVQDAYEVYAISNCGMKNEKVYYGLQQVKEAEGYLTLVIVKEKR